MRDAISVRTTIPALSVVLIGLVLPGLENSAAIAAKQKSNQPRTPEPDFDTGNIV